MKGGFVIVRGHAGLATGAAMNGGTVVVLETPETTPEEGWLVDA